MTNSTSLEESRKDFEWAVQWRTPGGKIERYRYKTREEAVQDRRSYGDHAYVVHRGSDGEWRRVSP